MITNFYEIFIPIDDFQISRIPYTPEELQKLRFDYNEYCSFFRNGDYIYISPMKEAPISFPEPITLPIKDNLEVVESLIRHIFFRSFREKYPKYLPTSFSPFSILSLKPEEASISDVLPDDLKSKIDFRKSVIVNLRKIKYGDKIKYGFVISLKYNWIFNKTVDELISENYDVVNKPVIEAVPLPGLESVLAPNEKLIGIIKEVNKDYAIVTTNSGDEKHDVKFLYLQKSKSNIGDYLTFKIGANRTNSFFGKVNSFKEIRFNPNKIMSDINTISELLSKIVYKNLDSFYFEVSSKEYYFRNSFNCEDTSFIYDPTPGYSSKSILSGLISFGPYDSSNFDKKSINLLVICSDKNRGAVAGFLGKLRDGIPASKYFKNGLKDLFRLHTINFEIIQVKNLSPVSYEAAIDTAFKENKGRPFDLAIIEGSEESKNFAVEDNPYFRAKVKLLTLGIPVQAVKDDTFRMSDFELSNILGPLSLQIYAKLGGIPWVLPSAKNIDREIVIGIGSTIIRKNLFSDAEQSRIVGLTTIFAGDGRYLVGKQLRDVPYENYFVELLESLKRSIDGLANEYGWNERENVRIVFHIFKPIKNIEADVISNLISSYPKYNIQYAFVTIAEKHPFVILEKTRNNKIDNYSIPNRGTNFLIDDYNCLLQVRGIKETRTSKHKFSNPLLIKINENSTFVDINYISQQIQNFSHMSWRSFNPTQMPVTLFYSELIAKMSSKLRKLGLSDSVLDHHFKDKKWFL